MSELKRSDLQKDVKIYKIDPIKEGSLVAENVLTIVHAGRVSLIADDTDGDEGLHDVDDILKGYKLAETNQLELDFQEEVIAYQSSEGFLALAVKGTEAEERCEKSPEYIKRKLV